MFPGDVMGLYDSRNLSYPVIQFGYIPGMQVYRIVCKRNGGIQKN